MEDLLDLRKSKPSPVVFPNELRVLDRVMRLSTWKTTQVSGFLTTLHVT